MSHAVRRKVVILDPLNPASLERFRGLLPASFDLSCAGARGDEPVARGQDHWV